MSVLAVIRPGYLDLPLFVHVLGAMLLVGAAVTGFAGTLIADPPSVLAWARGAAFRILLVAALPAFVLMRVGAEWIRIKEFGDAANATWITIGYSAADSGGVLLIVAIVLAWLGARRGKPTLTKIAAVLVGIALAGWIVTAWAMGAKPA